MTKTIFASLISISALLLSVTLADTWDGYNNPERMGKGRYIYDFNALPKSGAVTEDRLPWPETYWATHKGGVAYRWQAKKSKKTPSAWNYMLYPRETLIAFNQTPEGREVIKALSPAEKFDIWQMDYSYPTVRSERDRTSPKADSWAGLCHGWTPASLHHNEPTAKTVKNADGIEIPFGSSDIKGMLIYYYGRVKWQPIGWTGKRCRTGLFGGTKGCRGVNAGTMHLVMTNQLGRLNEAFIMDRDRYREIWNQPFYNYSVKEIGSCSPSDSAQGAGAVYGIKVQMTTDWVTELRKSQWEPYVSVDPLTQLLKTNKKTSKFTYCLEMTGSSRIVGGTWISEMRPGFIWNHRIADFTANAYYGRIQELLNDDPSKTETPSTPGEVDPEAPTPDELDSEY